MPNTPSTQRAPSNDNAPAAGRDSWPSGSFRASPAHDAALDGLHQVEELGVEAWLHLSLGLETG